MCVRVCIYICMYDLYILLSLKNKKGLKLLLGKSGQVLHQKCLGTETFPRNKKEHLFSFLFCCYDKHSDPKPLRGRKGSQVQSTVLHWLVHGGIWLQSQCTEDGGRRARYPSPQQQSKFKVSLSCRRACLTICFSPTLGIEPRTWCMLGRCLLKPHLQPTQQ